MNTLPGKAVTCIQALGNGDYELARSLLPGLIETLKFAPEVKLSPKLKRSLTIQKNGIAGSTLCPMESACLSFAYAGYLEAVKFLITEAGCNPQCHDLYGRNLLFLAAQQGHFDTVKYLVDEQNVRRQLVNAVKAAAINGHLCIVQHFFEEHSLDCPIQIACAAARAGHTDIIKYLIEEHSVDGYSEVLCIAIEKGYLDIVKYLVKKHSIDEHTSALNIAVRSEQLAIIKYLVKEHSIDGAASVVCTAAKNGYLDIIKYLAEPKSVEEYSQVLLVSAQVGRLDIIKYLLKQTDNAYGLTNVLCVAARKGYMHIVKYLVEDLSVSIKAQVVFFAVKGEQLNIVRYLIEEQHVLDVSCQLCADTTIIGTKDSVLSSNQLVLLSILNVAASMRRFDIIRYLVKEHTVDGKAEVVDITARNGCWDMVRYLVKKHSVDGQANVVCIAAVKEHWDIIKYLVREHTVNGQTKVVAIATDKGCLDIIKYLVKEQSMDGQASVIRLAALRRHVDIIRYLAVKYSIGKNIAVLCNVVASQGHLHTLKHIVEEHSFEPHSVLVIKSALLGEWETIRYLVKKHCVDHDDALVVKEAVLDHCWEIVIYLIKPHTIDGNKKILVKAALDGCWSVVKQLAIQGSADAGAEVVQIAAVNRQWDAIKYLVKKHSANANVQALRAAVVRENFELVKYLVSEHSVDGHAEVVDTAAMEEHWDIIKYLVKEQSADEKAKVACTAAAKGHLGIIKYLIKEHTVDGQTKLIRIATCRGHIDIVRHLVKEHSVDGRSDVVLQAAWRGYWNIIRYLVEEHSVNGESLLVQIAMMKGCFDIVKYLVKEHSVHGLADIIDLAAGYWGCWDIVRYLVKEHSLDENAEVVKTAIEKGCLDIVKYLVKEHSVHGQAGIVVLSATYCHWDIIKYLVEEHSLDGDAEVIEVAVRYGHLHIIEYLVKEHSVDGRAAVIGTAVKCGHLDIIKYLVKQHSVDGHATNVIDAAYRHHWDIVTYLLDTKRKSVCYELLSLAVDNSYMNIIKYFIDNKMIDTATECSFQQIGQNSLSVQYLREKNIGYDITSISAQLVCYTAWSGELNILKYLVDEQKFPPNEGHFTPLHAACYKNHSSIIEFLLSTGKVDAYAKDINGHTPLDYCKIYHHNEPRVFHQFLNVSSSFPVSEVVKTLVVGHPSAGKSTITMNLSKRTNEWFSPFFGQFRNVSDVESHTAGIIPMQLQCKELGHITMYDFAGHPEYYSSHASFLHNLLHDTPAVFICVVNVNNSIEQVLIELNYWISFIENEAGSKLLLKSQVIFVGTHEDLALKNSHDLQDKCSNIREVLIERLGMTVFCGMVTLDGRKQGGIGLNSFWSFLGTASNIVRQNSRTDISLYCNMLWRFLAESITTVACTIEELSNMISMSESYLPHSPTELCQLLSVLNDHGLVLLIKNGQDVSTSWVIVNQEPLLSDVNGTLFSPQDFRKHKKMASNTGIIPMSNLAKSFQYDTSMLIGFLKSLEFCEEIKAGTLAVISSNLSRDCPSTLTKDDVLLFFPALVKVERPKESKNSQKAFKFGWCLSCVKQHQFLSSCFVNTLILRLAYLFALAPITADSDPLARKLDRRCFIWKNGLHWVDNHGLESLVEVQKDGQTVVVMISLQQGQELAYAQLCSSLVTKVLSIQQEICPHVELQESLILPSQLQHYPWIEVSNLSFFDIKEIARVLIEQKPCAVDNTGRALLHVKELLPLEPYQVLVPYFIKQLFDFNKANEPVSRHLLHYVKKHCSQVLSCSSDIHVNSGITHQSLKCLLNRFSLLAGRNPLVS